MQILAATDFSQSASAACDVAAELAKKLNLPLRVIHCGPAWIAAGEIPMPVPVDDGTRQQLENEVLRLQSTGTQVEGEYCEGAVHWEVLAAAVREKTRLLVVGSTGHEHAMRWLEGSVAESVARDAPVPTLVVRQPECLLRWLKDGEPMVALCGVDFSPASVAAVEALRALHAMGNVEVEAAHIAEDGKLTEPGRQDVKEYLQRLLKALPAHILMHSGQDAEVEEFLTLAHERGADLIVLGERQLQGWERLKTHSFSRQALAHAKCNVLCVPAASLEATPKAVLPISRVLVAMDFTPASECALRHALRLLPSGGELRLLHVCKNPDAGVNPIIASEVYFENSRATQVEKVDALRMMNDHLARIQVPESVRASAEVLVHQNVAQGINEVAERFDADVVCAGSKGHSRLGAALLGSTTQAVIAGGKRPVYVVRPEAA